MLLMNTCTLTTEWTSADLLPSSSSLQLLAMSDLHCCRCIHTDHLGQLALPVAEFLALLHQTAYAGKGPVA